MDVNAEYREMLLQLAAAIAGPDDGIVPEYKERMNNLARAIDAILNAGELPKKVCFALLMCRFGADERVNYISNGERSDMIRMMEEYVSSVKSGRSQV